MSASVMFASPEVTPVAFSPISTEDISVINSHQRGQSKTPYAGLQSSLTESFSSTVESSGSSSLLNPPPAESFFTCEPNHLIFRAFLGKKSTNTIHITNIHCHPILYKVKTTDQRTYVVQSANGLIQPNEIAVVQVIQRPLRAMPHPKEVARQRFMVVVAPVLGLESDSIAYRLAPSQLWSAVPSSSIQKHTIGVSVQQSTFYVPLHQLISYKPSILAFVPSQDPNGSCCSHLDISNISELPVLFKMKTTNHMGYIVRPRVGIIYPGHTSRVDLSSQPKSKRVNINGEITADPLVPVSRPSAGDKFKLEVAAVSPERLLGNVTAQELWPFIMRGDTSMNIFPVLRNADPRSLSPSELPSGAAHRLRANTVPAMIPNEAMKYQRTTKFTDSVQEVLFWTPKRIKLRAECTTKPKPSLLNLSNLSSSTMLYRICPRNICLYEISPEMGIIPSAQSITININIQNLKVTCDDWMSLSDELDIEVCKFEGAVNPNTNLDDLWSTTVYEDVLKVRLAADIVNVN